jgi:YD repeat-containing protein
MPDNGIDGIVNTAANLSSFGNDSGVVTFTAQNGMAQTLLPINVSTSGTLPVNGYLSQGAFGSEQDSVGTLLSQDIAVADSSQDGVPWAYSLDTHVRVNLLVDDAANHVKRIEVIRPGGNAVVFDFAWNSTTGMFSPTGTPEGWNGRDAQQTFVLRALNPTVDTSLNYELLFANGIVQTFNGNLVSVSDSSTGLTQTVYGGSLPLSNGQQNVGISPRYNITLNWTDGNLSEAEYQTKGQAPQTIDTAITYGGDGGNDVTGLNKTDNGSAIPQFSYSVAEETILGDGIEITRSGSVDSGSVEIDTVLTGGTGEASGSSTSETYTFNEHGLVTSDALTLNGGSGTQSAPAATSYQYQGGGGLYTNGEPQWAKVTLVTNPDGSWVGYSYDPSTGWVTARLTPFQSGDGNVETYGYDPTQSGNGQAPDPSLLVQPPDTVTDYVLGTQTGKTFNDYNGLQIITREALTGSNATWATAGMFSTTTISAYDAVSTNSISGNLSEQKFDFGGAVSYVTTASWLGPMLSNTIDAYNAFGVLTSESAEADGQPSTTYTATASDGFGRTTQASLSGGLTESFNYYPSDWLGPSSVTEADGSTTMYTYTPLGQVATETDDYGLQYSTVTSYVYDAMGNVVSEKVAPADGSSSLTDTFTYDAQGRQTSETDNAGGSDQTANRTTSTVYTSNGTYNISTTTNPDGSTDIEKDYLDGSVASVGGTAQTPASYSYGVIGTDTPDGDGNAETQGSTYATASTDGGQNTTTTYSNVLGEDYLSVESAPGTSAQASAAQARTVDSLTNFDGNQRPTETIGFDGSKSFDVYAPTSGQLAASWTSMDGSDTYAAGVDPKTLYSSGFGGSSTMLLSTSGTQTDTLNYTNGGLTTTENLNGLNTTTETNMGAAGTYSVLTTNPDGTQEQDTYTSGLLTDSEQLDTGEGEIADTHYDYNANGTLKDSTDYTGTTQYTEFQDGTEKSVQAPGQAAQQVTSINSGTEDPTGVTNPNNSTSSQTENTLGQTTQQSGAGLIASTYGYNADGQLTSLTTYPGGDPTNSDDEKAATTTWQYDQATGLMTSKTYNDGTQDTYKYNAAGQLKTVIEPGMSASFGYNAAGVQTSSTAIDSSTGLVSSQVQAMDDQGRPVVTTSIDNGQIATETETYTALGQPQNESFGAAGNVTVAHGYYPTTLGRNDPSPTTESPDALASMTIQNLPNGQANAQTTYGYDPSSKRLQTITVNGVTFTIADVEGSTSQIASVTTSVAGQAGSALSTTFSPYSGANGNASMLGGISVSAGGSTLYSATLGYNTNGQIATDNISSTNSSGSSQSNDYVYTYGSGTNDNGEDANSLTQVTDNGTVKETYNYDGVGNFIDPALGDVNTLNQYAALSYNLRGDVTNDATYAYTYDANDRMISVTPDDPDSGALKLTYGYDSQGRRTWKDVYTYDDANASWDFAYSRSYVYDGTQLVGELNTAGQLVTGYTWSPSGQLLAVTDYTQATPKTYVAVIDASGNTAMLVDPTTGAVAASYTYDSYGNLLTATGPAQAICSILGKGLEYDIEDREMGHALGRDEEANHWMERDEAGEIVGGSNLYVYLGGDPIDLGDTSGLAPGVIQIAKDAAVSGTTGGMSELVFQLVPSTRQPVENVVTGAVANIVLNGMEPTRPFRLMMNDAAALNQAGVAKSDASTIAFMRQVPIMQSVIAGTELYDSTSYYGADFAASLDATGKLTRGVTIASDVVLVFSFARVGFSAAPEIDPLSGYVPKPSLSPTLLVRQSADGFWEVKVPGAVRRPPLRSGHIINPFVRGPNLQGVLPAARSITIDLSSSSWKAVARGSLNLKANVIYLLRDTSTGQILKVGQTASWSTRFSEYVAAGNRLQMPLQLEVFELPDLTSTHARMTVETQMRSYLEDEMREPLPWDNSIGADGKPRLGRPGSGIP